MSLRPDIGVADADDSPFEPSPGRLPSSNRSGSAPAPASVPAATGPHPAAAGLPDASRRATARPVLLRFRPGVCRLASEDMTDPTVADVVRALCRALRVAPGELAFAALTGAEAAHDGAWVVRETFEAGAPVVTRLCRVDGMTGPWLEIGRARLVYAGWRPPPPFH
ncbi:MAG: hypothetical protein KF842_06945 [Caulobacter sp.]|nr:hypothetical protein [Caulobacter sp.]